MIQTCVFVCVYVSVRVWVHLLWHLVHWLKIASIPLSSLCKFKLLLMTSSVHSHTEIHAPAHTSMHTGTCTCIHAQVRWLVKFAVDIQVVRYKLLEGGTVFSLMYHFTKCSFKPNASFPVSFTVFRVIAKRYTVNSARSEHNCLSSRHWWGRLRLM